MVKANHLPKCVKGILRNTNNVVGNFVTWAHCLKLRHCSLIYLFRFVHVKLKFDLMITINRLF